MLKTVFSFASLIALLGCNSPPYPKSDHFDGRRFSNVDVRVDKGLWQVLKWKLTSTTTEWPAWRENSVPSKPIQDLTGQDFATTYVNHASHLLQFNKINILTDPVFSERVSPVTWAGPKRHRPPGVALNDLPRIDVVVISHNHYDHMDKNSIHDLAKKFDPLFVVPIGNARIIKDFGANKIIELDWWQETTVQNTKIFLVPAQHWSSRSLFDRNKALWGGYVFQHAGKQYYFAGDTGYGKFFVEIEKRFGPMDVSFLPIGAYEPRWFMSEQHMNPEEAVKAHLDLRSRLSIGTHFGTFQLTDEGIDVPAAELKEALKKHNVAEERFLVPEPGG